MPQRQNLAPRTRILWALIVGFPSIVVFGQLGLYVNGVFLYFQFLSFICTGMYLTLLRCPRCKQPVYKRIKRVNDIEVSYWGGWIFPKRCSKCDYDLSSTE
jgi:hypothetical protein